MEVDLDDLKKYGKERIIKFYATIPSWISLVEIKSDLHVGYYGKREKLTIRNLPYLPKRVTTIKLTGNYIYEPFFTGDFTNLSNSSPFEQTVTIHPLYVSGNLLADCVAALPNSVRKLVFNFSYPSHPPRAEGPPLVRLQIDSLIEAVRKLSSGVNELDLSGVDLQRVYDDDLIKLTKSFPKTLKSLSLTIPYFSKVLAILLAVPATVETINLNSDFFAYRSEECDEARIKAFTALGPSLINFSLKGNMLWLQSETHIAAALGKLSNLITLDLGANGLEQLSGNALAKIFSSLSPNLSYLGLSENNFIGNISISDWSIALAALPPSVHALDLGDSNLLAVNQSFLSSFLAAIPRTIKGLRLFGKELAEEIINGSQLAARLVLLPPHINTYSFSESCLFNREMSEVVIALQGLPETVRVLDLGHLCMNEKTGAELAELFSGIPPHIKTLKLQGNCLACLSLESFKQAFAALVGTVTEIDLADNGLDRLSRTQLNQYIRQIPETVKRITLDANEFSLRDDGALIPYPRIQHYGLFKPQQTFSQQRQFAQWRLALMQLMQQKELSFKVMSIMLSYLLPASSSEINQLCSHVATPLITVNPPLVITSEVQQNCLNVVRFRIESLTAGTTKLDLSRCGLNRLDDENMLEQEFEHMPSTITSISFRGNGFQDNKRGERAFIKVLEWLPNGVIYLDLSDNGFERYNYEQLSQLFINLPSNIQLVSLAHEAPISPANHLARRRQPSYYAKLINPFPDTLTKARTLLNDYTKGDSFFWRLITGHWNRHHTANVTRIIYLIDNGIITSVNDLQEALEQIPLQNDGGSLAKRLHCITQMQTENMSLSQEDEEVEVKAIAAPGGL